MKNVTHLVIGVKNMRTSSLGNENVQRLHGKKSTFYLYYIYCSNLEPREKMSIGKSLFGTSVTLLDWALTRTNGNCIQLDVFYAQHDDNQMFAVSLEYVCEKLWANETFCSVKKLKTQVV